jgi:hypothetical protein
VGDSYVCGTPLFIGVSSLRLQPTAIEGEWLPGLFNLYIDRQFASSGLAKPEQLNMCWRRRLVIRRAATMPTSRRMTRPAMMRYVRYGEDGAPVAGKLMVRHRNPSNKWESNDMIDIAYLACATVHCDVVVTERQWVHELGRSQTLCRHGTIALHDVAALTQTLRTTSSFSSR